MSRMQSATFTPLRLETSFSFRLAHAMQGAHRCNPCPWICTRLGASAAGAGARMPHTIPGYALSIGSVE